MILKWSHTFLIVSNFHFGKTELGLWNMQVGQKKAREMWFLAKFYSAQEADKMGLVNKVVPVSFYCSPKLSTRLRIILVLSAATLSSLHISANQTRTHWLTFSWCRYSVHGLVSNAMFQHLHHTATCVNCFFLFHSRSWLLWNEYGI